MSELVKSMMRCSWTLPIYGARQSLALMSNLAAGRRPDPVLRSIDDLSAAAEEDLSAPLERVVATARGWQQRVDDELHELLSPTASFGKSLASSFFLRGGLEAMYASAIAISPTLPKRQTLMLLEFANKLFTFSRFEYAHQIMELDGQEESLSECLQAIDDFPAFTRPWVLEGLGYACAATAFRDGEPETPLLAGEELSSPCFIPFHVGLGMVIFRRGLTDLVGDDPGLAAQTLDECLEACRRHSHPGCSLAAVEALGLIVRSLEPESCDRVDGLLAGRPKERAAFWHGFGRGLYFSPLLAIPGSSARGFHRAGRETSERVARGNALAGYVWALTLVNYNQPEILDLALEGLEDDLSSDDRSSLADGISSAALVWREILMETSDDTATAALLEHPSSNPDRWRALVAEPIRDALADSARGELDFDLLMRWIPEEDAL